MNARKLAALATILLLAAVPAVAQEVEKEKTGEEAATATAEATHVAIAAEDVTWGPAPPSLPAGAEVAVLAGDPTKEGPFVMRARLPDGYRIAPHWHPAVENVTVISGTFGIGTGETFDPAGGKELGPGGLFVMQPETAHFAWASGETVIQVHSIGPWQLNYINPADDPRNPAEEGVAPQGR